MKTLAERFLFPRVTINKVTLSERISGKTIVITGASYGIGEQLALLLSGHNVHLVLIARTREKLETLAANIRKNGSQCTVIAANLYSGSEVDRVIAKLQSITGGIDIFISNAGKSITRPLADSLDRYHDFTRTNALNYLAPVKMLLAATPLLSRNKGQIINVSTVNVLLLPAPKWAAYQASKTAFDQWFRCNLAEWKAMGIKSKTIYLPLVRTRMIAPNENYRNYPAMEPEQAALRIAKLLCSSGSYSKPWWAIFPQIASFFGRWTWEKLSFFYLENAMGILFKIKVLGLRQIVRTAVSVCKHGFTLLALLDAAKKQHSNICIADDHGRLSYDHLYKQSLVLARHLNEQHNIGSKSRVGIVSANSIDFVRSLFAVSGLGADIFLLNPNHKDEYFKTIFEKHKITLIIAGTASTDNLQEYGIPLYVLNTTMSTTATRGLTNVVKRKKSRLVILSSASGGQPTVERRKISVMQFLNPITHIISQLHLKENKSVLISVPVFHGYGLAALFLSFFLGQKIRLTGKFDAGKTWQILKEDEINCWIAVPVMIQKVLTEGDLGPTLVKSIISGGDVLPPSVVETIHKTTRVRLSNMYGTSETGVCTIASDEDLRKYPYTIGKIITGVKTMILDAKGNFANAGETGRLFVKCGWSSDTRSNGFIATGDLVSANEEGYYFFKGRQDDLMVIGGENVYPIEIENVIYKHPDIRWVKARSITDSHYITKIHIDLVVHPESAFDQNQFLDWVSIQVPNYMIPKSVAVLSEQPVLKLM